MNRRNTGIAIVVLLLLIVAGGFYISQHPQGSSLSYSIIETGDRQHKESGDYYTIQVNYPDKTPLATRGGWGAETRAQSSIGKAMQDLINQFKDAGSIDSMTQEEKDRLNQSGLKYSLSVSYRPYSSGSFVSYEFDVFMDTGGAHPNNLYKTLVFDLNGNVVELGDLFTSSEYLTRISQMAETQVKKELIARAGADAAGTLIAEGLAAKEENFQNFVVDSDRIRIFIPPYQAAAYAAGSFEVQVPLLDVKDILRSDVK